MMIRQLTVVALGCYVLTLSSIAAEPDTRTALLERAMTLWNARVVEDWETEYDFLPAEEINNKTLEAFVALRQEKGPFRYVSAQVGEAAVDENIGWVEVKYAAQPKPYPTVPPQSIQMWDIWHRRDGQWYPMARGQRGLFPKLPPHHRPAEEESILSARAQEFLKAREHKDWEQVYQFLKPKYRDHVPVEQFVSREMPFTYLGHHLEWAEVIGEQGRVKVALTYQVRDSTASTSLPRETIVIDDWVKVDGQWYRHKP